MSADLIIHNGRVKTMDERRPRAEALAISGGHITHVGRSRDVLTQKGRRTRVIDAAGATVLPGFIESHMHLFGGGAELATLDLFGIDSMDGLARRLIDYGKAKPDLAIIVGNQTNYTIVAPESLTRHVLDRMMPDRPVLLYAPDHHTAWANTIALERAGLLRGKACPPGHEVVMGADGLATGELREPEAINPVAALALDLVRSRLGLATGGEPEPYPGERAFSADMDTCHRALQLCAQHGITSFQNMDGNLYTLELLAALERQDRLLARAVVPFHFKPFMPLAALERASTMAAAYRSPWLKSGLVKFFMDGVLDSGTAVMLDDYPDQPGWRGEPLFTQAQFNAAAADVDRRGLQIAVHAIGDGAVRMVLDGYAAARKANGARDSRHRIEHIEVVHPRDIARFRNLGVVAAMQPPHPPGCHGLPLEPTVSKIGAAKLPFAYVWNRFRKAGVPLAFGTDWPVSDISPMRAIQSAMTRQPFAPGIDPHRQTLEQALHSYTCVGAYAEFSEGSKGVLRKGYVGDAVVLDRDIEDTDPEAFHTVKVRATVAGGRITHQA